MNSWIYGTQHGLIVSRNCDQTRPGQEQGPLDYKNWLKKYINFKNWPKINTFIVVSKTVESFRFLSYYLKSLTVFSSNALIFIAFLNIATKKGLKK